MTDRTGLRIATWNLERRSSKAWRKAPAQERRMREVDADIWVFTETFVDRTPGAEFDAVFSPPHPVRRPNPDERWAAVWSRCPLTELKVPAAHRRGSVAALVEADSGPIIVYGCVIAYAHEPFFDDGSRARAWEVHADEVRRQGSDWELIRDRHPGVPLVVAGDFNQARSGRRSSYGTNASRQELTDRLHAAGLVCLTEVDLIEQGQLSEPSHVEHICASGELEQVGPVMAWDRVDQNAVELSDHPTLAVDLTPTGR